MITDFSFDGATLSSKGYMLCSFDNNNDETVVVSGMDYTEIKAPLSDASHKVAHSYPENYTKTLHICRKYACCGDEEHGYHMCADQADTLLSDREISAITRWLCRKDYKWFNWIYDTEAENLDTVYYLTRCKVSKVIIGGECHGLEITLITNSPYGYSAERTVTDYRLTNNNTINIGPDVAGNDEEGYIYPYWEFYFLEDGDWTFTNETDWDGTGQFPDYNRVTSIANVTAFERITIAGGDVLQLTAKDRYDAPAHESLYRDFNFNFPRICCTYATSNNKFRSRGPAVRVTYKYRSIRKVGL